MDGKSKKLVDDYYLDEEMLASAREGMGENDPDDVESAEIADE